MIAKRMGYIFCLFVVLIVSGCASVSNLEHGAFKGDLDKVRKALAEGEDINQKNPSGRDRNQLALHYAAWNGHLEIIKYLISNGADINLKNANGETALHSAVQCDRGVAVYNQLEIIKYLISHGADITQKDYFGRTALHHAVLSIGDSLEVVQYLLSVGADPSSKDLIGRTAKDLTDILYGKHKQAAFLADYEKQYQLKQQQLAEQRQKEEAEQREKERIRAEQKRLQVEAGNQLDLLKNKQACKLQETGWAYLGSACNGGLAHGIGKAENPSSELLFEGTFFNGNRIEGVVHHQGKPLYEGKIVDGKPDGSGICYHQGEPEECRYYKGKRVDGLYKQRLEMAVQQQYLEMLKAEMDKMKEQQALAAQNGANQPAGITDGVKKALMDKAAKQAANMIFDHLF